MIDNSPQYPEVILSEDEKSYVYTSKWGATVREFKLADSTPEFLEYKVTTPEAWEECKARMLAGENRIDAHLHSCGNIMSRIDDLVDIGVDGLNPLEVKAGMKPLELKEKYGDKLLFHGGINAQLCDDKEAAVEEVRRIVPKLKENGGYIFSSDHSIPNSVSLETFRAIVEEVKRLGWY